MILPKIGDQYPSLEVVLAFQDIFKTRLVPVRNAIFHVLNVMDQDRNNVLCVISIHHNLGQMLYHLAVVVHVINITMRISFLSRVSHAT